MLERQDQDANGPGNGMGGNPWYGYEGTVVINGVQMPVFSSHIGAPSPGDSKFSIVANPGPNQVTWPSTLPTVTEQAFAFCFAAGTLIRTPGGEMEVEKLKVGDEVCTTTGRLVPVRWLGKQTIFTRFGPAERLLPVRFKQGSLGDGIPHTDLTVTSDHAILIDNVLCNAGALVNGSTIARVPLGELGDTYTVYHVETAAHNVIIANGAPAETFIDNISRSAFDNYDEYLGTYGEQLEMTEMPFPRALSSRQLPASVKQRLHKGFAA